MTDDGATGARSDEAPPRFADPRRVGAVIGLVGAVVFVFSYTPGFTDPASAVARVLTVVCIGATVWFLFVQPRFLGPFVPPRAGRIGAYLACVVGEFALIAVGTRWLGDAGEADLRPALIALVVGLHFLPFAWAFAERMFYALGGSLVVLGGSGLLIGTRSAALVAATGSGVVMSILLLAYSLGAFAPRSRS